MLRRYPDINLVSIRCRVYSTDDGRVEDLSEAVSGWIRGYVCTAAQSKCKRIAGITLNINTRMAEQQIYSSFCTSGH
jgi:hypothetical protein